MGWFFAEGGLGMYPTLAFGLLLLAVAVAYVLNPGRKLVPLFAGLATAVFVCGALGLSLGLISTFMAAGKLPEAQQYGTTMLGIAESLYNLDLALACIVLSTLVLAFGTLRAALAQGRERS